MFFVCSSVTNIADQRIKQATCLSFLLPDSGSPVHKWFTCRAALCVGCLCYPTHAAGLPTVGFHRRAVFELPAFPLISPNSTCPVFVPISTGGIWREDKRINGILLWKVTIKFRFLTCPTCQFFIQRLPLRRHV